MKETPTSTRHERSASACLRLVLVCLNEAENSDLSSASGYRPMLPPQEFFPTASFMTNSFSSDVSSPTIFH